MKVIAQLTTSAVALGTLLAGAASHATNIQELPLRASVLAKPNVVVALDDSGSMDSELLMSGNFQAWAYFERNSTTLYPSNALRTNGAVAYLYLFPTGVGAGSRVYSDAGGARALPATPQFAWARASEINPIYYNSSKTYEPWSPAWSGGAKVTFANSTPAAAKTHPLLGSTTVALNADLTNTGTEWRFTYTAGMVIPAGSTTFTCESGSVGALPYTVTTSNRACIASSTYYPATFWMKEDCTIDGTTCVYSFDGSTKLKRYEIKAGNTFPSGRTYTAELQNFANWFTYYRKRRLFLGSAMGDVLEYMTGLNVGVVNFNNRVAPTMYDLDSVVMSNNRLAATTPFYTAEGSGSTPTHATMAFIANEFDTNTNIIKYACQRNAMFVITDGFANDTATAPPAYDPATYGTGAPYTTRTANSLHDKALAYFTRRLRETASPLPAGRVPPQTGAGTNLDTNTNLHINTYGITLGMPGSIYPTASDPFVSPPSWPTPVSNTNTMIDDLWHATINGRGAMYSASDPAATVTAIQDGLLKIISQNGAQSGVAVSTVNLVRGDSKAYFANYNPSGWRGDVTAKAINPETAVISSATTWSAAALLDARAWGTRVIASQSNAGTGVEFTAANVGATVNPGSVYGTTSDVIEYLRGNKALEGTTFRKRTSVMGAVINSEPVVDRGNKVLYVASGEGMLHAFDTDDSATPGKELWAFVPRAVLPDIGATVDRAYSFKTQLDGTPVLGTITGGTKLLVAGMGAAGRSYFAIDVTSPRGYSEATLASKVKWEFPTAADATTQSKMGQTLGLPVVVKSADGDVVLVTSGYNNTLDGKGRLWVLNASTGTVVHEFTVAAGTLAAESGLAHVSAYDDGSGVVRYVYGGDLLGNVWRFDLQAKTSPDLLATLTGPTGAAQPVTAPLELAKIEGNRVVVVPTGRLLDISDAGNTLVQSLYVIKDGSTLTGARSSLVQMTYTRATDTLSGGSVDWATGRGWFVDLPAGEQANTRPAITYGGVAFITNVNGGSDCSASAFLYLIDVKTGKKLTGAPFAGTTVSSTENSSALTRLITKDQKLRFTSQRGGGDAYVSPPINPPTVAPSKSAWREVRAQ